MAGAGHSEARRRLPGPSLLSQMLRDGFTIAQDSCRITADRGESEGTTGKGHLLLTVEYNTSFLTTKEEVTRSHAHCRCFEAPHHREGLTSAGPGTPPQFPAQEANVSQGGWCPSLKGPGFPAWPRWAHGGGHGCCWCSPLLRPPCLLVTQYTRSEAFLILHKEFCLLTLSRK